MVPSESNALHNAIIGIIYSFMSLGILMLVLKPEKAFDSLEAMQEKYREMGSDEHG